MKSFFKKIGKGLKKLGKGIMKIMSSKIGRIIGMVSLAFGVGSIFKAMYQGVMKGTAASTASLGAEVGAEAVKEGVTQGTVEVGKEVGIKAAEKAAETLAGSKAAMDATLEGVVAQTNNLTNAAGTVTGESVLAATSEGVTKAVANGGAEVATKGATFTPEVVSATTQQVGQQATQQTASTSMGLQKDILASADGAAATTTASAEAGITAVPDSLLSPSEITRQGTGSTTLQSAYAPYEPSLLSPTELNLSQTGTAIETGLTGSLPEGASTYNASSDLLTAAEKTEIANFNKLSPKKLADTLKDPLTRERYDALAPLSEGLKTEAGVSMSLSPSSQLQGVQEFTSFKEAFQGGDNLISSLGNVAERGLSYDLGELTKGKLTGFVGSRGVYNTAQATAALLAKPETIEMPSQNPYAAAEVATLSQIGATTAYQAPTMAMDFSNQMATGNVANPFTTLNQIRQKAGFGNIYGSLNSMASMQAG